MPDHSQHDQDEALEAPPRLVAVLKRLPQAPVFIPPTADEAVLRAARSHLPPKATGPECARPRAQRVPTRRDRWNLPRPPWLWTLLRPRTGALRWAPFLPWVAAAVAIILLVALPQFFKQLPPAPGRDSLLARGDLNHDGQVDVLDAFALASQLKQAGAKNLQLDLNGDGVVDELDVATLAARAVKLDRGGRS